MVTDVIENCPLCVEPGPGVHKQCADYEQAQADHEWLAEHPPQGGSLAERPLLPTEPRRVVSPSRYTADGVAFACGCELRTQYDQLRRPILGLIEWRQCEPHGKALP